MSFFGQARPPHPKEMKKKTKYMFSSYRREHVGVRNDQPQVDVDGRHDPGLELEVAEFHGLDLVEAQHERLEVGGLARGGL